jgi:hypothetical protein
MRNLFLNIITLLTLIFFLNSHSFCQSTSWFATLGGLNIDEPSQLTLDNEGNIITVGSFESDFYVYDSATKMNNTKSTACYLIKLTKTGNLIWQKKIESDGSMLIRRLTVDKNGNIYLGGYYETKLYYDTTILISPDHNPQYKLTAFIMCLDPKSNLLWDKNFSCQNNSALSEIAINDDVIYFSVAYRDSTIYMDHEKFKGIALTSTKVYAFPNHLFGKMNIDGNLVWGKVITCDEFISIDKIGFFHDDHVVISGRAAYKYLNFGDSLINVPDSTGALYIAKLDADGKLDWIKFGNVSYWGEINNINVDQESNIFIGGFFSYFLRFPELELKTNTTGTTRDDDIFIMKFDSTGAIKFGKSYGRENKPDYLTGMDIKDNIIFSGSYTPDITIDTFKLTTKSRGCTFIAKMDKNGTVKEIYQTKSYLNMSSTFSVALAIGNEGQIILTGYFNTGAQFDTIIPKFRGDIDGYIWSINKNLISVIWGENKLIPDNLSIYPNPVDDYLKINDPNSNKNLSFQIFDLMGRSLLCKEEINNNSINVSTLKSGTYIIKIKDKERSYVSLFIKK